MVHSTWTRFLWWHWENGIHHLAGTAGVVPQCVAESDGSRGRQSPKAAPQVANEEVHVPLPQECGTVAPQHPPPRDAAGYQGDCEGTSQPQAAQGEPIDEFIDLTTPPRSTPHTSYGNTEPQGSSSQPASTSHQRALPLIRYLLPPRIKGGWLGQPGRDDWEGGVQGRKATHHREGRGLHRCAPHSKMPALRRLGPRRLCDGAVRIWRRYHCTPLSHMSAQWAAHSPHERNQFAFLSPTQGATKNSKQQAHRSGR